MGSIAAAAQVQAGEVQIGCVAVFQRSRGVGDGTAAVGYAVAQDSRLDASAVLRHGELSRVRPGAHGIVVFIQGTDTPVVFTGIGACIFIVAGVGGIDNFAPVALGIGLGAVGDFGRLGQQLNLETHHVMQRYPLVNRVDGLLEIRHLVKIVDERSLGAGKGRVDMNGFGFGKFAYGLVMQAQGPHTPRHRNRKSRDSRPCP